MLLEHLMEEAHWKVYLEEPFPLARYFVSLRRRVRGKVSICVL